MHTVPGAPSHFPDGHLAHSGSDPTGSDPSCPLRYAATLGSPASAIATSFSEYSWSSRFPAK